MFAHRAREENPPKSSWNLFEASQPHALERLARSRYTDPAVVRHHDGRSAALVTTIISDAGRDHLRLQLASEVGPVRARALLDRFGQAAAVLEASSSELQRVDGIGPKVAASIISVRDSTASDREIERAAQLGLRIVTWADADYPAMLRNVPDPPICLYVRGQLEPADSVAVAVVGTRRCSHYGREQALRFGGALASAGFTVISGLARGIDGFAHQGALDVGGRTIAVLGQGLSTIYPPEHEGLAERIAANGAVLSELPVDAAADPKNFPRRNRIVVGLSLGVLVVEAGERSGALISARLATEYNREVFALPGRVDCPDVSMGTNRLIRDGHAKLVMSISDILDELGDVGRIMGGEPQRADRSNDRASTAAELQGETERVLATSSAARQGVAQTTVPSVPTGLTDVERVVWESVHRGVGSADDICATADAPAGEVVAALTTLQLRGLVRRLPGDKFTVRIRE